VGDQKAAVGFQSGTTHHAARRRCRGHVLVVLTWSVGPGPCFAGRNDKYRIGVVPNTAGLPTERHYPAGDNPATGDALGAAQQRRSLSTSSTMSRSAFRLREQKLGLPARWLSGLSDSADAIRVGEQSGFDAKWKASDAHAPIRDGRSEAEGQRRG